MNIILDCIISNDDQTANKEDKTKLKKQLMIMLHCIDKVFNSLDDFKSSTVLSENKSSTEDISDTFDTKKLQTDLDSIEKNDIIDKKQFTSILNNDKCGQIDITDILENISSLSSTFNSEELLEKAKDMSNNKRIADLSFHFSSKCTESLQEHSEDMLNYIQPDITRKIASENSSKEAISFFNRIKLRNSLSQPNLNKKLQMIFITTEQIDLYMKDINEDEIIGILKPILILLTDLIKLSEKTDFENAIFDLTKILGTKTEAFSKILSGWIVKTKNIKITKKLQNLSEQIHLSSSQLCILSNIETEEQNKKYEAVIETVANLSNQVIQVLHQIKFIEGKEIKVQDTK
ncbi:uncharacterized protein [Centruroides vittatus]|uniref:uncharacterized protein n=1 Tax=Centruroides vittatus TaxID=120091 RepID=UPI00350F276B